jgi:hypothetical protein
MTSNQQEISVDFHGDLAAIFQSVSLPRPISIDNHKRARVNFTRPTMSGFATEREQVEILNRVWPGHLGFPSRLSELPGHHRTTVRVTVDGILTNENEYLGCTDDIETNGIAAAIHINY